MLIAAVTTPETKEVNVAEIPIQEKRGGSKLPLIIGAIVLLLALWLIFGRADDDATPAGADTTRTTSITSEYRPVFAYAVDGLNRSS